MANGNTLGRDSEKLYEVKDGRPYYRMRSLMIPVWILESNLNSLERIILAFILFKIQGGGGNVLMRYSVLERVGHCGRTTIYSVVNHLQREGYIQTHITSNGGGPIEYSYGQRTLELFPHDTIDNSQPIQKVNPLPIQIMNAPRSDSEPLPFKKRMPPVQKMNASYNKEIKEIKEGEEQNPPSYRFTHSFLTEKFKELLLLPSWDGLSSSSIRSNYEWLKQKERDDPYYPLAAMEYSLNHNYRGIFNERDYAKRAAELRRELAIVQSQPIKEIIPETESSFHFMGRTSSESEYQVDIKNRWSECRGLLPPDLQDDFFDPQVCFGRSGETLMITVPQKLYNYLAGKNLPSFAGIKYELKPIQL